MHTTTNNGHVAAPAPEADLARALDVLREAELALRPVLAMLSEASVRLNALTTTPEEATR